MLRCKRIETLEIKLDDITIDSKLKKTYLCDSIFFMNHYVSKDDMNNTFIWFNFKPVTILGEEMHLTMCFKEEDLFMIRMYAMGKDFPTSWDNWSKEGELKRKKVHDTILRKTFKRKPDVIHKEIYNNLSYSFIWGKVSSIFDSKSGGSCISITYQ